MRHPSWLTNYGPQGGSAPAVLDPAALILVLLAIGFGVVAAVKGVMALRRSRRKRDRWGDAH